MDDPFPRFISALHRHNCDPRMKSPDQYASRCPAHRGNRHNLSIRRGDDGRILLHCHHVDEAGQTCTREAIVQAVGLTLGDLYPRAGPYNGTSGKAHALNGKAPKRTAPNPSRRHDRDAEDAVRRLSLEFGSLTASWTYHTAAGEEAFRVLRFDPPSGKTFRPIHPTPDGWLVGDPPGLLPPYRSPELPAASRVHVSEGEKAAEAVRSLGLVATTSAHGAQSPAKTDWSPLAGKDVVILPDHDKPGEGYVVGVMKQLAALEPRPTVRVVRLESLWRTTEPIPDGADVVEWLDIGVPDSWDDDQCRAALERVVNATAPESLDNLPDPDEAKGQRARLVCAADIEARPTEWLWEPRIALGVLTSFAGDPKLAKSMCTLSIAAAVSRGAALPMDRAPPGPANVIIMSAEDDASRVIKPRLVAAGADVSRIHILESIVTPGNPQGNSEPERRPTERPPTIVGYDTELIEREAIRVGNVRLIIIDPVTAYLADVDDHRNAALRGVLWPLKAMAERLNAAVVLVTHLSKGGGGSAKHRVIGSIAYVGACRANFIFVRDPDDPTRRRVLMCDNGTNLAAEVPTLSYTVEDRGAGPAIEWGTEALSITADQAIQAQVRDADLQAERRECDRWLRQMLTAGRVPAAQLRKDGADAGFSWDALKRAKNRIGAQSDREGFGPGSKCYWYLGAASSSDSPSP